MALERFAGPVEDARFQSRGAVDLAEDADRRRRANMHSLVSGSDPSPATIEAEAARKIRHAQALMDLENARELLAIALANLDAEAERCASSIRRASDGYKDNWLDDAKGWVRKNADWIRGVLDLLSAIAMAFALVAIVIAVVAAVIGTGGLALGPIFAAAAFAGVVASVAGLAAHGAMLASDVEGVGWGEIAFDVVGLVTFGAGYKFAKAGQAALRSSKSAIRYPRPAQVRNASRIQDRSNNLRKWADATIEGQRSELGNALTNARPHPGMAAAMAEVDKAQRLAQLKVLSTADVGPGAQAFAQEGMRQYGLSAGFGAAGTASGLFELSPSGQASEVNHDVDQLGKQYRQRQRRTSVVCH